MGWFTEHLSAKYEREVAESNDRLYREEIERRNLVMAYSLGIIDAFEYLKRCREIGETDTEKKEAA